MQTAVNVFVIEPMRYWVSGDVARPDSTSASPTVSCQTTSLPRKTEAATDGRRCSD